MFILLLLVCLKQKQAVLFGLYVLYFYVFLTFVFSACGNVTANKVFMKLNLCASNIFTSKFILAEWER